MIINLDYFTEAEPLSLLGIVIASTAMTLGASYLYMALDKKPLFSPAKILAFLLGYILLWIELAGYWSWTATIALYWLAFFLISIPFSIDFSMRLTLSLSLVSIAVSLGIFLDHALGYIFPFTYWVVNPLAVPFPLYLGIEGLIAFSFFLWGFLWRRKQLFTVESPQLMILAGCLATLLILNIHAYSSFRFLSQEAYTLSLFFPLALLILVLVWWVNRHDLSSARLESTEAKLALAYLHKEVAQAKGRNEDLQDLHHDFRHQLALIRQLLIDGKEEKAQDYIDQTLQTPASAPSMDPITGNTYLDAILHINQQEALSRGLQVDWQVSGDMPIDGYDDLALALSNLLENAIRESASSSQARLSLQITIQQGLFHVKLTNSYQPHATLKKGRGQAIAQKVFKAYQGEVYIVADDNIYQVEAMAYI